jgi:hypothetical protein
VFAVERIVVQSEEESDPLGEVLPLLQLLHDEEPVLYWYWPAEQLSHKVSVWLDDDWYLPAWQLRQEPEERYSPREQLLTLHGLVRQYPPQRYG